MLAALPLPAGPAQHETLASYLNRLAALHGLPVRELWDQLSIARPGSTRRVAVAERLAVVTDRPPEHLFGALPELRDPAPDWTLWRHQSQPGCPRCDARHEGGPVLRLLPHHHYVCTKHHYWIGPPDAGQPATPLDERLSDIVTAQRQHQRVVTRLGGAAMFDAVLTGFLICGHLWANPQRPNADACRRWTRRTDLLIPPGAELRTFTASRLFAAVYPEAVSLAAIIASPLWRQRASGDAAGRREFLAEAARRLGGAADEHDPGNQASIHWMLYDSHHPPSRPKKTLPDTRDHGAMRRPRPSPLSQQRTDRSADWFKLNRRGGNVILYHRHLTPVITREWAPPMDDIAATIAASGSTIGCRPPRMAKHGTLGVA
ncbi:TniQ family protein [Mycobacterium kansasii]|uniref:TniQ family protein n=1 Tax=Mycobacterium kansasii TaxID=1768 RepID=UPI001957DFB2|nr:TniQ family protein [Mycobacterium kansasii]